MNFQQHVACFVKLLDNNHITEFNKRDVCGALCDKYHLIIIFQYFMRADFKEEDYTPENFFLALTLSHDIYEDTTVLKTIIMGFYYSRKQFVANKLIFQWNKLVLFGRMKFKGYVEKKICNNLIDLVPHKIMAKTRRELHTGFLNNLLLCDKCRCPVNALHAVKLQEYRTDTEETNAKECKKKKCKSVTTFI